MGSEGMARPRPQKRPIHLRIVRGLPFLLGLGLAGCGGPASPSLPLFGAYFPSWLICGAIGVLGALAGRVLFIRLGVDEGLPLRSLVYICLALLVAFVAALLIYGR